MQSLYLSIVFLFGIISLGTAQDKNSFLFGSVSSLDEKLPLEYVHILNPRTQHIATSDAKGYFRIPVQESDTLILTSMGYERKEVHIQGSKLAGKNHLFYLKPQHYILENVSVGQYRLSGYTDIDVQLIPDKKLIPAIDIGIPQRKDIEKNPKHQPSIFNPVDLLYDLFGDTPKQLRMVEKIKQERKNQKQQDLIPKDTSANQSER